MKNRSKQTIAAAAVTVVAASGCARAMEEFRDAPIGRRDDSPADVINMPDGFSNLATKCDPYTKGVRVYVTKNSGGHARAAVAVTDPNCQ